MSKFRAVSTNLRLKIPAKSAFFQIFKKGFFSHGLNITV